MDAHQRRWQRRARRRELQDARDHGFNTVDEFRRARDTPSEPTPAAIADWARDVQAPAAMQLIEWDNDNPWGDDAWGGRPRRSVRARDFDEYARNFARPGHEYLGVIHDPNLADVTARYRDQRGRVYGITITAAEISRAFDAAQSTAGGLGMAQPSNFEPLLRQPYDSNSLGDELAALRGQAIQFRRGNPVPQASGFGPMSTANLMPMPAPPPYICQGCGEEGCEAPIVEERYRADIQDGVRPFVHWAGCTERPEFCDQDCWDNHHEDCDDGDCAGCE